jgi:heme-degrading monooxygenase HmoA
MFVVIATFPEVTTELDGEFRAWFAWSNNRLRQVEGLTGRRLMLAADGTYAALVEHTSAETFAAMQGTEAAAEVHARLGEILHEMPRHTAYEVVVDLADSRSCCGGHTAVTTMPRPGHAPTRRSDPDATLQGS